MTFSSIGGRNRKIKVLHLITSLEVGGAQHGLLLGLPRFDSEKYEHIVCSLMDRIQMAVQFQRAGIEVHSLGLKTKIDFSSAIRLRTLLKEINPDILVVLGDRYEILSAVIAANFHQIPIMWFRYPVQDRYPKNILLQ